MISPFITKLEHGCRLTEGDREKLTSITGKSRLVKARQDIISEGEVRDDVHLVLDGVACRYKILPKGKRQIMALLLPGDFCDLHVAILGAMDHSIGTISACTIVEMPRAVIDDLTDNHPRITRALWWSRLVDEAILREWLVTVGGRSADRQLAHFFCEMLVRLQVVGRADASSYDLPMTQQDLGDTMGISVVHVNRSLAKLRADGLITLQGQRLTVVDLPGLVRLSSFDPNYLHLHAPAFDPLAAGQLVSRRGLACRIA